MSEALEDRDVPTPDYALLDRAGASQWMFFPRPDPGPPPPGASDHEIEVAPGINISARLYSGSEDDAPRPLVLYFHGNGEVVSDHDGIDRFYREIGLDLFVAEFRGYGKSGGRPSMAALVGDALPALEYALALQAERGGGPLFVMGRSMGTQPALEVAARAGDRVRGLIIESGAASARRSIARFGLEDEPGAAEFIEAHEAKVRSIRIPSLQIHGEADDLAPIELAAELYNQLENDRREFVAIEGAGHNDILWIGRSEYFAAIRAFVDSLL